MSLPTVREVWRLALPTGTQQVGGEAGLDGSVLWARRMAAHAPAFGSLEEGEMALLSVESLALLDDRLTLTRVASALADRGASALGIVGDLDARVIAESDRRGFPLFQLPLATDLRDVERDIIRLIVEHEAQVDRRRQEIREQLTRISIEDGGLGSIAAALRKITGKPVLVHDPAGAPQAVGWDASDGDDWGTPGEIPNTQSSALNLPSDRSRRGGASGIDSAPVAGTRWTRHTAGVVIDRELVAHVSLLSEEPLDDLDELVLELGTLASAVEIVKQRAVAAAEDRMRGDFLAALLTADSPREPALARRATELGYAIDGYHTAVAFSTAAPSSGHLAILASDFRTLLLELSIRAFISPHEDHLVALCNAEEPAALRPLPNVAHKAWHRSQMRATSADQPPTVAIGLGRPAQGLPGLRSSVAQAEEALSLAEKLSGGDRVLAFSDLGVYTLLFRLRGSDELTDFFTTTLGPLIRYDAAHSSELVETLDAFFGSLGNASQAAEALFIHRNSLLYRLERIAAITGLDLNDADDRFALQLALRMRPFVSPPRASD